MAMQNRPPAAPWRVIGPAPFTMLVAGVVRSGNVSEGRNPTRVRNGWTQQQVSSVSPIAGVLHSTQPARIGNPNPGTANQSPTAEVTVLNNTFVTDSSVWVGPYEFRAGWDFAIGAGVNATATALAAAISLRHNLSANAVGAVVTVEGPVGLEGGTYQIRVVNGANLNFEATSGFTSEVPTLLPIESV